MQQLIQVPGFPGALLKFLPTKGPNFYTSCKGSRSQTYFFRTPSTAHTPPQRTQDRQSTSWPYWNTEQALRNAHLPKPNSMMLVRIKETGPLLGFLFHHCSSASRKVKLLCASQLLIFFFPYGKAEHQSRENTWYLVSSKLELLPWQAYHSEFNEKNPFRHQTQNVN